MKRPQTEVILLSDRRTDRLLGERLLQSIHTLSVSTFTRLVMDADGLRLIVPVIVLDTHQVGVGAVVETRPHGQDMFIGLIHGLHQLQGQIISVSD